jgi:hypothetical protein
MHAVIHVVAHDGAVMAMMVVLMMVMVVMMTMAAIGAPLGLKRVLDLRKVGAKHVEHLLDHVVGPNAKDLVADFSRQMSVPEVPGQARKLVRIVMPNLDDELGRRPDLEPSAVGKLQAITIGHGDGPGKVEQHVVALIRHEANAAAMTRIEIERKNTRGLIARPMPCRAVNGGVLYRHLST